MKTNLKKQTLETVAEQRFPVSCAGGAMKKYIYSAALLFVISMCVAPAWAQLDGVIKGTVKGQDGKPLVGAVIQIYEPSTGRKYSAKTNPKGEYLMNTVYAGTYKATLLVNGNPVDEKNNVGLGAGQEQVVDWDLAKDLGGGMTEEQRKQIEAAQKQNKKIEGLNASLKQAKELEGAGNYDQAITILQQSTQVDPNQDLVWAYLGDAQRGAKKYADAVESYQKALALKPNTPSYMAQLGDAYAKSGQVDKAIAEFDAAATADPKNAGIYYYNEGAMLTNIGKVDDANAALDKAIQADPSRADAYYWKGVNLMSKLNGTKLADPQATAAAFNKYLELAPTGKYADATKQLLVSIGAPPPTNYSKPKSGGKKQQSQ